MNRQASKQRRKPAQTNARMPQPQPQPQLTTAEQAGVATHEAICSTATNVKDGVVWAGGVVVDTATSVFQFLRRTVTGA